MSDFKNVKFQPWEGCKYREQDVKIFILGESFINNGDTNTVEKRNKNRNRAIEVIEELKTGKTRSKDPKRKGKFKPHNVVFKSYNNTLRMLHNQSKVAPLLNCWDMYAFVNFFQEYLGDKTLNKHSHSIVRNKHILEAQKSLPHYLEGLQPDLVIVWGSGKKMKENWFPNKETRILIEGIRNFYQYNINDKKYNVWFIPHPSSMVFNKKEMRKALHADYKKIIEKLTTNN